MDNNQRELISWRISVIWNPEFLQKEKTVQVEKKGCETPPPPVDVSGCSPVEILLIEILF